jgi:hypothetical protein
MVRQSPHVLSARITPQQLAAVRASAAAKKVTLSDYLRAAVDAVEQGDGDVALEVLTRAGKLADTSDDPAGTLATLISDLGLPENTSPADVLAAVQALIANLAAPESGDASPAALSRETLSAIAKKGMTVPEFLAAKKSVTRRAGAK